MNYPPCFRGCLWCYETLSEWFWTFMRFNCCVRTLYVFSFVFETL